MRVYVLATLVTASLCYESGDLNSEGYKKERRIAGGGNYGGFIGLVTYGAGYFGVKGKYEQRDLGYGPWQVENTEEDERHKQNNDNERQRHKEKDIRTEEQKNRMDNEDAKVIINSGLGYGEGRRNYYDRQYKDSNEYIEYLGYNGYCGGQGYYNKQGNYDEPDYEFGQDIGNKQRNQSFYDEKRREKCDRLFGYTGPTANDEPENLIRPCALDDWQCIRKYFAANSKCKPAYGPIPDPLFINLNTVYYPHVNLTVTLPNLQIRGLSSAKIREFYVNKVSGNLVFAINVTNMNETIPRAYLRYQRTAKESIVLADYATVNYRSLTFTAVIPKVPHLRLDLADIHHYSYEAAPLFFIGPGGANSTDPDVISAFTEFGVTNPINVREGLAFQTQLITSIYIQKNICDFGLKMISV